jgi:hypothetical protein
MRERYPFSSAPLGIPRGALTEITGHGKTEVMIRFLSENPRLRVAWIEDEMSVYPCAILQRGVRLDRVLFVEAGRDLFWAVSQCLRSGLFECVVLSYQRNLDEKTYRRLQLEVEKADIGLFLLPEMPQKAWPISMKLQVERKSAISTTGFPGVHGGGHLPGVLEVADSFTFPVRNEGGCKGLAYPGLLDESQSEFKIQITKEKVS